MIDRFRKPSRIGSSDSPAAKNHSRRIQCNYLCRSSVECYVSSYRFLQHFEIYLQESAFKCNSTGSRIDRDYSAFKRALKVVREINHDVIDGISAACTRINESDKAGSSGRSSFDFDIVHKRSGEVSR